MAHCLLFLAPYTNTTTVAIRFTENGTNKTANISAGSRYLRGDGDTNDLAKALSDALTAAGVGTWSVSVSYNTDNTTPTANVTISVSGVTSARILWEDVLTTADGMRWGFDANTATALSFASDTNPTGVWMSDEPYTEDTPRDARAMSQVVHQNGATTTTTRGDPHQSRRVGFDFVAPERTLLEAEDGLGSSVQRWWRECGDGHTTEVHKLAMANDMTVEDPTTTTRLGGVLWVLSQRSAESWEPQRLDAGVDLWAWGLELLEVVS